MPAAGSSNISIHDNLICASTLALKQEKGTKKNRPAGSVAFWGKRFCTWVSLVPLCTPPPASHHPVIVTTPLPPALSLDSVFISPLYVCVWETTHCASLSSSVSSQHAIAIPWVLLAKPVTKPQDNVPVKTASLVSRATAVLKATSRAARPLPPA